MAHHLGNTEESAPGCCAAASPTIASASKLLMAVPFICTAVALVVSTSLVKLVWGERPTRQSQRAGPGANG